MGIKQSKVVGDKNTKDGNVVLPPPQTPPPPRRPTQGRPVAPLGIPVSLTDEDFGLAVRRCNGRKRLRVVQEQEGTHMGAEAHVEAVSNTGGRTRQDGNEEGDDSPGLLPSTGVNNNTNFSIGSRVYALFPENGLWYWGIISSIGQKSFSVLFDDGDETTVRNKELDSNVLYVPEAEKDKSCVAPPLLLTAKHVEILKRNWSPEFLLSLLQNCITGSRVYCIKEGQWGVIERKSLRDGEYQYAVRLEDDSSLLDGLGEADILSKQCYERKTDGRVPPACSKALIYDSEYDNDSGTEVYTTFEHHLVGRGILFVWIDVYGQKKEVQGYVEACEVVASTLEATKCLVVYEGNSKSAANTTTNRNDTSLVPLSQWWDVEYVIDGSIRYDERASKPIADRLSGRQRLPEGFAWHLPDVRVEEECVENGTPVLKLSFGEFLLEFRVQESSISGAGMGVFLACSLREDATSEEQPQYFQLEQGKCLDIGIYAPLCAQDRKSNAVCTAKGYCLASKCDVYFFDANESNDRVYDITDNVTGDLHDLAKQSILSFVNESNDEQQICIYAGHDPTNAVHYTLGNQTGTFTFPCDGTPREVFIYYGQAYEKVRIKNGYSFVSKQEQRVLKKEIEREHITDVQEMGSFCSAEIDEVTRFMLDLVQKAEELSNETMDRVITCAVVLLQRADILANRDSERNSVDLSKELNSIVDELLDLAKFDTSALQILKTDKNVSGLCKAVLKRRKFTDTDLKKLQKTMER